ncbi:chorismate--pyruvate lyase family protein [Gluconobacter wancherniae]|uniref:chorismate--pyruvate lyase family protein n=1 Tax=Gluconobacter wancherniae TaxID=1307955 RepID=UPI001D171736|nr:hypothetical protein [Gluconobacter wancherniae]
MTSKSRPTKTIATTTDVVRTAVFLTALSGCTVPEGDPSPRHSADVCALRARLNSRPSATAVLQAACPVPIRVIRLPVTDFPSPDIVSSLGVTSVHDIVTRHVRLMCGGTVLSDAWNWYVPSRLTGEMNRLLTETDTPFGRAVHETHFHRKLLESIVPEPSSKIVLENRALLLRASDHAPIALVVENYTPAALKSHINSD